MFINSSYDSFPLFQSSCNSSFNKVTKFLLFCYPVFPPISFFFSFLSFLSFAFLPSVHNQLSFFFNPYGSLYIFLIIYIIQLHVLKEV